MAGLPVVVKLGGSLFDLPDLGPRLRHFLDNLTERAVLLVPGGGRTADVVRNLDRCHGLGQEAAHWLALRALTLNAYFFAELLQPALVIEDPQGCLSLGAVGTRAILDGHAFARRDELEGPQRSLPHCWSATSDSLAARAAHVLAADRLILLKSMTMPSDIDWETAAQMQWVDAVFPEMVARAGPTLTVEVVNFREWAPVPEHRVARKPDA